MLLSKSKYMKGLQCDRLLWFDSRKKLPEYSEADKMKFEEGHDFEEYAHKLFPKGVNLTDKDFGNNLKKTKKAIENKQTCFEAGVAFNNYYSRSDILEYKNNAWNLYEIKSSNDKKPEHIEDLAFQKFILESIGLKIKNIYVITLNRDFVKKGKIDPKELTKIHDVTSEVNHITAVEQRAKRFFNIILSEDIPEIDLSRSCNSPYECPLKDQCWSSLPENNVFLLTNHHQYWKWFHAGIEDLKDVPMDELKPKDEIITKATLKKKPYVNKEEIKKFLDDLKYPLYHFDFETFQSGVPKFDNTKPWQQIPFQYSLHVQDEDNNVIHYEFLSDSDKDPRKALLEQLQTEIGTEGDIIVFNQTFEIKRFEELARDFPEHKEWINKVISRIVDLASPFNRFLYYNPKQEGSKSLKKVLPALTDRSHNELEITNGGDASALFYYSHIKNEIKKTKELRENLLKYCELDTEAMILIVNKLKELVE
jgi:CRISPR/Cas system-associated exonuclease Cas4 (RecB family)